MLEYAVMVDRGRVHETNDDEALANHSVIDSGFFCGSCETETALFAVADGVGSLEQSVIAARESLRRMADCAPNNPEEIFASFEMANRIIQIYENNRQLSDGLSCTVCLVAVDGESISTYNLGNSRCYRFRNGATQQLTKDQTKKQELIDLNLIPIEKIDRMQDGPLTKYMGHREFDRSWIDYRQHTELFNYGDSLLICSDGLHGYVDRGSIEETLLSAEDVRDGVKKLVNKADEAGGIDNVTVVLIKRVRD
ncbi:MAG: serine/threonine-protein phosphatase [Lachnospiraceae bacterium]|nr:serine/threonine-protein phosphatase [Lachnospiraceae bacterium]